VNFAYMPLAVRQQSPTVTGKMRYRPIVPIHILAPQMLPPLDACIDSGADDTVFPPHWATRLGIDLGSAPRGQAQVVGGSVIQLHFATVTLLLSDGYETCEWDSCVGFAATPMRWALLGHAGFLEFFDVQLLGARRETIIIPNTGFAGQHIVVAAPPP
jgi:Aspartyl protease